MSSALAKRLEKLEALITSKLQGPTYYYALTEPDYDTARERLIADGVITAHQPLICIEGWRWRDKYIGPREPVERAPIDIAYGREVPHDDRTDAERVYGAPPYKDVYPPRQTVQEEREDLAPRWLEYPPGTCPH